MTEFLTSHDGTRIAFDRKGSGPALILVDGAMCYRGNGPNDALADELADAFTVYRYDRRGKGESGDTGPYSVDREYEDLQAVAKEAGDNPYLYGISSGGALALDAVAAGLQVKKLALYELPYVVDQTRKIIPEDYEPTMDKLIAEGKRSQAVTLFMAKGVGLPGAMVAMMHLLPAWSKLKSLAHTLPYDTSFTADLQRGNPLPEDRWTPVTAPTVVICGTRSPAWMRNAMRDLATKIPNAKHQDLKDQTHLVKAKALAPVLKQFFTA